MNNIEDTEKTPGIRRIVAKILFVIGVIIILTLLIFLIIRFVPVIFNSLANVGSSITNTIKNDKTLMVSVNDWDIEDNENFLVSWNNHAPQNPGSYFISYGCADHSTISLVSETATRKLICNTPYELTKGTKSVELLANYTDDNTFADIPVIISFTEDNKSGSEKVGEVIVTLKKDGSTEPKESNTPTGDLANAVIDGSPIETSVSTVAGPADLAILNLYALPGKSSIQFTVRNLGGKSTGPWNFSYTTPTRSKEIIHSPTQPSLAPGAGILYTITFSEQDRYEEGVAIVIDSFKTVYELNKSNNAAALVVTGRGTGSTSGGNYNSNHDADFKIEDLEVGYLSGNRFIKDDRMNEGNDIAIRFTVRNIGGDDTNSWRFEARDIPYNNSNSFRSKRQDYLKPGESTEIIVEFENVDEGNYRIRVEVDSDDNTNEEKESNNVSRVNLNIRN